MINNKTKYLKKSSKIVTILIVILLFLSFFSSVVVSRDLKSVSFFKNVNSKIEENIENSLNRILEAIGKIKDRLLQLKERLSNFKDRFSLNKNSLSPSGEKILKISSQSPLIKSIQSYVEMRSLGSFNFYTNYNGNEKQTLLRLYKPVQIDVDDDGDKDIEAQFSIFPGIENPLIFTFNIKLKINRLEGFDNPSELFLAYLEFYFPGLLIKENAGDRVRFGYESPKNELVPDSCIVTYKYVPYLLYEEKPRHDVKLNPGSATNNDNLSIYYGYQDVDSEDIWKVEFSPAVNSAISLTGSEIGIGKKFSFVSSKESFVTIYHSKIANESRNDCGLIIDKASNFSFEFQVTPFKSGGGKIEYERISSDPVDIKLFVLKEVQDQKDPKTYMYIDDLPKHILFQWQLERDGLVELNAFGDRITQAGISNSMNPDDATAKVYFNNLPSIVGIRWKLNFSFKGDIEIYSDAAGCSAHVYSNDLFGTGTTIKADFYTNLNIDMSIHLNFVNGYFSINRSNADIDFDLSVVGKNGSEFDLSGNVRNTITEPFEIFFGKLSEGEAEVVFFTKSLEIHNLNVNLYVPNTGNFTLQMQRFIKTKEGNLTTFFSIYKHDNIIVFNCSINITNGVEIIGLVIGYNDFKHSIHDIFEIGDANHFFSFTLRLAKIDIWISEDGSEGYICISGGMDLIFNSEYKNQSGVLMCILKGAISFDTGDGEFNISWKTINGNISYDMNGTGVVSLSGFNLWVKDKFDVNISQLVGSFKINTFEKTGEILLFIENGRASFFVGTKINITNLFNFSLKGSILIDLHSEMNGSVLIAWNESGITHFGVRAEGLLSCKVDITDLYFHFENESTGISISADNILFIGGFSSHGGTHGGGDLSAKFTSYELQLNANNAVLNISNLEIMKFNYIVGYVESNVSSLSTKGIVNDDYSSLDNLEFLVNVAYLHLDAQGTIKIEEIENLFKENNNGTIIVLDARGSINISELNLLLPKKKIDVDISFSTDLSLAGKVVLEIGTYENNTLPINDNLTKYLKINLSDGSFEFNDFYFNLNKDGFVLTFNSLSIVGPIDILMTLHNSSGFFNIYTSGYGNISLNNANITSYNYISEDEQFIMFVDLGLFEIHLDDIYGSVIGLTADKENITFEFSGSISKINICDLYIDTYIIYVVMEDEENASFVLELEIENTFFNLSGIGKFSILYDGNFSLDGIITGDNSYLDIETFYFMIYLGGDLPFYLGLNISDFHIGGPTTFHLSGEAEFDEGELIDFSILASCNSYWNIGQLTIMGFVEIIEMEGYGTISMGLESGDPNGLNFVIALDGEWDWQKLKILLISDKLDLRIGLFDGDAIFSIDFDILIFAFLFPNGPLPTNSGFSITSNTVTNIDLLGLGTCVNMGPVQLVQGEYSFYWNILEFDGDGFLAVDTDWNTVSIPFTIFEFLRITGTLRAENFNFSWDFNEGLFNIFDINGSIDPGVIIEFYFNGQWHQLWPIGGGNIEGYVFEAGTNLPVQGATVSTAEYTTVTNAQGYYSLPASEGSHTVTVILENYVDAFATVDVISNQISAYNFYIDKKSDSL